MGVRDEIKKQSALNIEMIERAAAGGEWITSAEISKKLCGRLTPMQVGVIIRHAKNNKKSKYFIYCDYGQKDHMSWLFSDVELDLKSFDKRPKADGRLIEDKQKICDHFCGKDWFLSVEAVDQIGVSSQRVGAILKSMQINGMPGYVVSKKRMKVSGLTWCPLFWSISKDEPIMREKSILSQRWV